MSKDNPYQGYHAQLLEKLNWLERENATLRADIHAHEQINKQLIKDKQRLDSKMILLTENGQRVHHVGVDLRAAIDAARKEAQP